jgi:hypothetical protein
VGWRETLHRYIHRYARGKATYRRAAVFRREAYRKAFRPAIGNWIQAALFAQALAFVQVIWAQSLAEVGLQRSNLHETSNYRADYKHRGILHTPILTDKRAENHDLASTATNAHRAWLHLRSWWYYQSGLMTDA